MLLGELRHILEELAPPALAWERDAVGLQIGSPSQDVRRVLLAVDVTDPVLKEARRKRAGLILSHHPVLVHPLRSLAETPEGRAARILLECARRGVALYAMHTNLDFTEGGVSMALAGALGLEDVRVLRPHAGVLKKIVVFVPADHLENVRQAMARAGAGRIGEYEACSFASEGLGTFRPLAGARPFIGRTGSLEQVREARLEMAVPAWGCQRAVQEMLKAHPYEEVAYDVYDLAVASPRHGAGAVGMLKKALRRDEFLTHVQRRLGTQVLRYSGGERISTFIRRVAVMGGSGADLVEAARQSGADAFVTGDLSYHRFQEGEGILLVDAGHYETERPVLNVLAARLRKELAKRRARVELILSTTSKTSVHYFVP